jgi:hypothetical protein
MNVGIETVAAQFPFMGIFVSVSLQCRNTFPIVGNKKGFDKEVYLEEHTYVYLIDRVSVGQVVEKPKHGVEHGDNLHPCTL